MKLPDMGQGTPEARRQLLEKLLRRKAGGQKETVPLSMGQMSIFLDHLATPESIGYNIQIAFRIVSRVSARTLEKAFQMLVDRHEILRTTYGFDNRTPVQTIHGYREASFRKVRLAGTPDETRVVEQLRADSRHPYDLFQGPVIRASLYTDDHENRYFLLGLHHIAGDARSLFNLTKELLRHYRALSNGEGLASVEMPRSQYRDFVRWEQDLLQSPGGKRLEAFWKKSLDPWIPPLDLPLHPGTGSGDSPCPDTLSARLDPVPVTRAMEFARDTGIGFYTVLFSAFSLLLHQYSGRKTLTVSVPTSTLLSVPAGQLDPEVAGYLVNPVLIRSDLTQNLSHYLAAMESGIANALDHQAYPFYCIQKNMPRESRAFTAMFNFLAFPGETAGLDLLAAPVRQDVTISSDGLRLSPFPIPSQEGDADLCMTLVRTGDSVHASVSFDRNRFSRGIIAGKLHDYMRLLKAMAEAPGLSVSTLMARCGIFGSPVLGRSRIPGRSPATGPNVRPEDSSDTQEKRCLLNREPGTCVPVPTTTGRRFWAWTLQQKPDSLRFYGMKPGTATAGPGWQRIDPGPVRAAALARLMPPGGSGTQTLQQFMICLFTSSFIVLVNRISTCRHLSIGILPHQFAGHHDTETTAEARLPLCIRLSGRETIDGLARTVADTAELLSRYRNSAPSNALEAAETRLTVTVMDQTDPQRRAYGQDQPAAGDSGGASLELLLLPGASPETFEAGLCFHDNLFTPDRQQALVRQFMALVDSIIADPAAPVSELNLVSPEDLEQILDLGGPPGNGLASDTRPVPDLFRDQVQQRPQALALICRGAIVSYKELDAYSDQVAGTLRDHSAFPGTMVGLFMGRSMAAIGTVIGIFKSGAVYVPIDPKFPEERILFMIQDAGIRVMLTLDPEPDKTQDPENRQDLRPKHLIERFRELGLDVITLDPILPGPVRQDPAGQAQTGHDQTGQDPAAPPGNQEQQAEPRAIHPALRPSLQDTENPAYIIYTSGSTGTPKGVAVSKNSLARHCVTAARIYGITRQDRVLQFASLGVDASLETMIAALIQGAGLVLMDDTLWAPRECVAHIREDRISVADLPPAYLSEVLKAWNSLPPADPGCLRLLISGGDVMPLELVRAWQQSLAGHVRLINAYGPTETTITALHYEIPSRIAIKTGESIPLGRPLPGRRAWVLDQGLKPVPAGVPGELALGGIGVATGYLNRPDLTRKAFIPCPVTGAGQGRVYRTGDRVRWRDDGNLEFLGRLDSQLNIRGFRIEPGEIESCLLGHPDIREAAATAVLGPDRNRNLKAGIACSREIPDLAGYLKKRLPPHMIPHEILVLDRLPRLASGKIDYEALAAMKPPEAPEAFRPPKDEVEAVLAAIWSTALGISRISMDTDFFNAGGHSLLAARIMSDIHQVFQVPLTLTDLFQFPVLNEFAQTLKERLNSRDRTHGPITPRTGTGSGALPLSPGQQRLWFLDAYEPGSASYAMPCAIFTSGDLDAGVVTGAFSEIIRRHASLRTTFSCRDTTPVQVIHDRMEPEMQVLACTGRAEAEAFLAKEASRPFDLETGPLLRIAVVTLQSGDGAVLFLNMHHIVSDGWSIHLLLNEFAALYKAFSNHQPSPLPDLPIQYPDFGLWQQERLKGSLYESQVAYWKTRLKHLPPLLALPTDSPRPARQSNQGGIESFSVDETLSLQVRDYANHQGATLFMTLNTVFSILLSRYTDRQDIVTGFPVSGRQHSQTQNLIGFFVNTLPLRVQVPGSASFTSLVEAVKTSVLEAFSHQDVPFDRLIDALGVERNISHAPLVQVIFSMITLGFEPLYSLFDSVDVQEVYNGSSKNDLTLFMMENGSTLSGSVEYAADLFTARTVRKTIEDFKRLLNAAVTAPDTPVERLLDACGIFVSPAALSGRDPAGDILDRSNLSRNQFLTYLGQLAQPDSPHYNTPHVYTITGDLDTGHFMTAFSQAVASGDTLHSRIVEIDGIPRQIPRTDRITCQRIDCSGMDETGFQDWLASRAGQVFDLSVSLYDSVLIRRGPGIHLWFMSIHHSVMDGWSWNRVFIPLISDRYRDAAQGRTTEPSVDTGFGRLVEQEKTYRKSEACLRDKGFWEYKRRRPHEPMAFYGTYPARKPGRLDRIMVNLGTVRAGQLKALVLDSRFSMKSPMVTLLHIMAAVTITFLHKISGNRTVSLGIPFHNRKPGLNHETIGLVMQTLPLRVELLPDDTFISLHDRIVHDLGIMRQHSNYTLSNPPDNPEYDVLLNVIQLACPVFGGTTVQGGWTGPGHGMEPLGIVIPQALSEAGLELGFDMNQNLFSRDLRQTAIGHFLMILDGFTANPAQRICHVPVLTPAETDRLIHSQAHIGQRFPGNLTVADLFEIAARARCHHIAVADGNQAITYQELDRRAQQVAWYLAGSGLGPEQGVGLLMRRSIDLFAAILGILKAGCFYVPIDPDYPEERQIFIIRDAGIKLVLTDRKQAGTLPAEGLTIQTVAGITETQGASPCPVQRAEPQNTVYVTYTSGSTGIPKGVAVEHRNLVNAYHAWETAYDLAASTAHLQMANMTFDVFSGDLVRALCSGARLVICHRETLADPENLYRLMVRESIDVAEFVPVVLRLLARYAQARNRSLDFMKILCCGSDTWYMGEYRDVQALCGPGTRVINSFGITETTIDSSFFELGSQDIDDTSLVPLGKPFANNRLYVLDPLGLQPVPPGVPGELFIGGAGVSRGYLNRPDLTARHFIPDPFAEGTPARMFRTGDMATSLADGTIVFLGRMDNQVKIRGFRIEPGEIESALSRHPDIRQSLVMLREDRPGQKQLVAYLVMHGHPGGNRFITELRGFLKQSLPEYMIPGHVVILEALPLLPNGKINRKSLPLPDRSHRAGTADSAPSTRIEKLLAQIWAQALGIGNPGIHDNFFQLGGDSILSIQVVSRAKQQGIDISVKQLFEFQTIHGLARVAGSRQNARPDQEPVTGSVPLTPVQTGFFNNAGQDLHQYNQSILLAIPETSRPELMEKALNHLLEHHDALRLTFRQEGRQWIQENAGPRASIRLRTFRLRTFRLPELARISETLHKSMNLEEGCLVRAALFTNSDNRPCRLLIIIHHLAVDGVSWRILLSDLEQSYACLEEGREIRLPLKTASFKTWAESIATYARTHDTDLGYWSELHRRAQAVFRNTPLIIPGDDPAFPNVPQPNTRSDAEQILMELDRETTCALVHDSHQAYATRIQELLVAALVLAMGKTTGQYALFMDMEGHGREEFPDGLDLSRTVGWFTSVYPVLLTPDRTDIRTVILHVKESLRRIPNSGITHGLLTHLADRPEVRQQVRDFQKPEIVFNYLGRFDSDRETGGCMTLAPEPDENGQSPRQNRSHLVEINGHVLDGCLTFSMAYHRTRCAKQSMETFSGHFKEALEQVAAHCRDLNNGCFTPEDFPLMAKGTTQEDLDDLLAGLFPRHTPAGMKHLIADVYPLTPLQEGMLFQEELHPGAAIYLIQVSGALEGNPDIPRMEAAYEAVVNRHSLLRTSFARDRAGRYLQVVHGKVRLGFVVHDLSGLTPDKQAMELDRITRTDRNTPFDFTKAPVMRCTLVRLGQDQYRFVLTNHHLLMDGWSTPLFFRDLFRMYNAPGREILPDPGAYRQFVAWTLNQDHDRAEDFWKHYLKGFRIPTPLPMERPDPEKARIRDPKAVRRYSEQAIQIPADVSRALSAAARQNSLTLNTVLQGAYALLLSRYSREHDIVYGVTASIRPADIPGIESMVGLFINTLPMRVRTDQEPDLIPYLKTLMENQAQREPWLFASPARVRDCSDLMPGMTLFESMFVFENYPVEAYADLSLQDIRLSGIRGLETNHYPLSVIVSPGTRITIKVSYDANRFSRDAMGKMLDDYRGLLSEFVSLFPYEEALL